MFSQEMLIRDTEGKYQFVEVEFEETGCEKVTVSSHWTDEEYKDIVKSFLADEEYEYYSISRYVDRVI